MIDIFNTASLAKLSRQELLSLLANLQAQFNAASGEAERGVAHARMEAVKRALVL
ncbi:hypothetical protein [Aurantiacibacter sp. D1-12]|uniref:hypothetical protein n=1 Tax=Aurantiacibacter sp. D1-12 TaxID=2993658 RepID=UPI00237CA839|nr:hypothetical protein [Aurantiacibacter sp. D1-12]MDE1466913.1 hypothetical protein [Aurantiacibacter sp. D1-12]